MRDLCRLIGWMVVDLIRSRATLEAEIWTLRQQINVLRRGAPRKLSFCAVDRMIFVGLYRMFPKICDALAIVKPDTHLSLNKDAPVSRAVDRAGHILCRPILGGLHHQYVRI